MIILVADAAPLIFLAKLSLLKSLAERLTVIIPAEVAQEATERQDLPDAASIRNLIDSRRLTVKPTSGSAVRIFQKKWGLGRGESAALVLSEKVSATLLTDDYAAMRIAKVLGVAFVTTPFLIVQMQREGLLDRALARAKLERLEELAWLSADVLDAAQKLLEKGEL